MQSTPDAQSGGGLCRSYLVHRSAVHNWRTGCGRRVLLRPVHRPGGVRCRDGCGSASHRGCRASVTGRKCRADVARASRRRGWAAVMAHSGGRRCGVGVPSGTEVNSRRWPRGRGASVTGSYGRGARVTDRGSRCVGGRRYIGNWHWIRGRSVAHGGGADDSGLRRRPRGSEKKHCAHLHQSVHTCTRRLNTCPLRPGA